MDLQVRLNSIAREVFRDQADADYIGARACYRAHLPEQFLWLAQQSTEKYLKGILLFNGRSVRFPGVPPKPIPKAREYGHDLVRLYNEVAAIPGLDFSVTQTVTALLPKLSEYGISRYLTVDTYVWWTWLMELDELVWHLRFYCHYIPDEIGNPPNVVRDYRVRRLAQLHDDRKTKAPGQCRVRDGYLERVLQRTKADSTRRMLLWGNRFFYSARRSVRPRRVWSTSRNSPFSAERLSDASERKALSDYIKF